MRRRRARPSRAARRPARRPPRRCQAVQAQAARRGSRPTVICGFSDEYGSWKIICIARRRSRIAAASRCDEVLALETNPRPPSARSVAATAGPASTCRSPIRRRSPSVSPRRTCRSTPSTARTGASRTTEEAAPDRKVLRPVRRLRAGRHPCGRARRSRQPSTRPSAAATRIASRSRSGSSGALRQADACAGPDLAQRRLARRQRVIDERATRRRNGSR